MSYLVLPRFVLAIDWETSGYAWPNYAEKHQGLSFGALVVDLKELAIVEELYCEIKHDPKYLWDSGAEKVHGLSREHLAKVGITQQEAAEKLFSMVYKYMGTDPIILLGHRVYFDQAFTKQLADSVGLEVDFHHTTFDTAVLGALLMDTWKSDEIFSSLGLPTRGKHNSLEDIKYTLESVKRMKELFLTGILTELELK